MARAFAEYYLECGNVVVVEGFLAHLRSTAANIDEPVRDFKTIWLINRIEDQLGVKEKRAHG